MLFNGVIFKKFKNVLAPLALNRPGKQSTPSKQTKDKN